MQENSSIQEKTVLVTGGTGSFGKTMVKHLLQRGCREIRILSRDEWKQEEMRIQLADYRLKFHIGDVRCRESVDNAMRGVDLVFHAAALKQVPSCEFFPLQAVQTNILGSSNVIESAIQNYVECVVSLGTDKAVYPVNAMGLTKAIMEKVVQAAARRLGNTSETRLCSVRYGNVMYSRGSVIPLFVRQIKQNLPLTVTEPLMTRFMMPLDESVALVEFAFENAQQGDVFIKKAASATIETLVEALKNLFESTSTMKRIGMRHGEKMHETLASAEELRRAEDMGDYFRIRMDDRDLDYSKYVTQGDPELEHIDDYSSHTTDLLSVSEMEELLISLPEIKEELGLIPAEDEPKRTKRIAGPPAAAKKEDAKPSVLAENTK
jgi:UDP-N-acetylglucosamine 4,6-dehydratase/5-epimerase